MMPLHRSGVFDRDVYIATSLWTEGNVCRLITTNANSLDNVSVRVDHCHITLSDHGAVEETVLANC
jgi:hypothetical protein